MKKILSRGPSSVLFCSAAFAQSRFISVQGKLLRSLTGACFKKVLQQRQP
jgi:hypothetical protein